MMQLITTADCPEKRRFRYWREVVCDHFFEADCFQLSDRIFDGEIRTTRINDITFSLARGSEHRTVRQVSKTRQTSEESVFITQQLKGTTCISQDGRTVKMAPGDFICFDSTRSLTGIQNGDYEQFLIHVPRDVWIRKFGRTEQITARVVSADNKMGALVASVLRQIMAVLNDVEPVTAARLVDVALSLVTAALGELVCQKGASQSIARAALLYRAKMYIMENLHDAELSPGKVAAALRICERYLHDLFHDEDLAVGRWIWQMRLEKCRMDLADPFLSGKSVSEIAFSAGFNNSSHFSRKFREAFSTSATEYRREQLKQIVLP